MYQSINQSRGEKTRERIKIKSKDMVPDANMREKSIKIVDVICK
jgi:hypothetical protein